MNGSGDDKFVVVFPLGTPLPARRQHTLQAPGSNSSVCLELYESLEKSLVKDDDKFAQVKKSTLGALRCGLMPLSFEVNPSVFSGVYSQVDVCRAAIKSHITFLYMQWAV